MSFDINDRRTWAWVDDAVSESRANDGYLLNPEDRHSFHQLSNGVPYLHQCPLVDDQGNRLIFNPMLNVCDWSSSVTEGNVYEWALGLGLVEDQPATRHGENQQKHGP